MIALQTSTLGVIDTPERADEYCLTLAAIDASRQGRGDWLAATSCWFKSEWIVDAYFRAIYEVVFTLAAKGADITDYTIAARLPFTGEQFGSRVRDIFGFFCDCSGKGCHILYYARQVHDAHRKRAASAELEAVAAELAEARDPDEVLEQLPEIATRYRPAPENRTADNRRVLNEIIDEMDGKRTGTPVRFGVDAIDRLTDGLPNGALIVAAGASSNGKSVLLTQLASFTAHQDERAVLFFSLEMSPNEIFKRWAAQISGQPFKGGNRKAYLGGLARVQQLTDAGLLHVFAGKRNVEEITAAALAYKATTDIACIVVDYVQIVPASNPKDPRERQVAHVVEGLKHLAMEVGLPVVTASQLNEDGQVRESRAIFNTANLLIRIKPDMRDKSAPVADVDLHIEKNRDGATDVGYALWEKPTFTIREKGPAI